MKELILEEKINEKEENKRIIFKIKRFNNLKINEEKNQEIFINLPIENINKLTLKKEEKEKDLWIWDKNCFNNKLNFVDIIKLENNYKSVIFHPEYSLGTAAIRAKISLNNNSLSYWEININNIFGSSMMFGIGTENALLNSPYIFANLLGDIITNNNNEFEGYGLSHKGIFYHGGINYKFCSPFSKCSPCCVGILFDGPKQKIGFTLNQKWLGWAPVKLEFFNKNNKKGRLFYPMVASTGQHSLFTISNGLLINNLNIPSLQQICQEFIILKILEKNKNNLKEINYLINKIVGLPKDIKLKLIKNKFIKIINNKNKIIIIEEQNNKNRKRKINENKFKQQNFNKNNNEEEEENNLFLPIKLKILPNFF